MGFYARIGHTRRNGPIVQTLAQPNVLVRAVRIGGAREHAAPADVAFVPRDRIPNLVVNGRFVNGPLQYHPSSPSV